MPRFTAENRQHNERLVAVLRDLAATRRVTASQLAIAWVLAKETNIVPLIGARTRAQLDESLGALQIALSDRELADIEAALTAAAVAGSRYDEQQMRALDSERNETSA
jgi:aryl-alcohol dehydrogenase-like predicted oxidoreductase